MIRLKRKVYLVNLYIESFKVICKNHFKDVKVFEDTSIVWPAILVTVVFSMMFLKSGFVIAVSLLAYTSLCFTIFSKVVDFMYLLGDNAEEIKNQRLFEIASSSDSYHNGKKAVICELEAVYIKES